MTLRLYDLAGADPDRRFSPYCWRIWLALAHKELAVETIPWRFTEKDEIAPSGERSPVLVDRDRWVARSWSIANYLEGTYPKLAFSIWRHLLARLNPPLFQPRRRYGRRDFSVCRARHPSVTSQRRTARTFGKAAKSASACHLKRL